MIKILSKIIKWRWFSVILLVAGVAATGLLIKTGPSPLKSTASEKKQSVTAAKVSPVDVVPWIIGYGEAQPAKTWKAVAQVAGKISWKSPKLKNGDFVKADEPLLYIDDSECKLKILSAEASIKKFQAKIGELKATGTNLKSQLEILKSILEFREKELKRQQTLLHSKTAAITTVEEQKITILQQRQTIDELEASLRLLPSQIAYQKAELAAAEADFSQRKLELGYTKIKAPFRCRIDTVSVEEQQYVTIGQDMFYVDGVDEMEIFLQFRVEQIGLLFAHPARKMEKIPEEKRKREAPNWQISVKINGLSNPFSWPGKFRRIASGMDTTTHMINMVIGVLEPYRRGEEVMGPPLVKGSFCTVKVQGKAQHNLLVVPRYALHGDKLYIADKDSRLEILPVKVNYYLGQYAIIAEGLKEGDTLILNDIIPAVKGMKLKIVIDENFYQQVSAELGKSKSEVIK